ncbi:MAG: CNNM domain-containing protein, partial [Endozoicomonadaceae bacterium]|nr:CNNM domain-containing protein [Endozoicomonadaceae bacterium]
MNGSQLSLGLLLGLLVALILLSAFFSSAETAMMALNRYKIRHKAKLGNRAAIRVGKLLKRTDHLLSIILIANNFINILVSSLATMIALRLFGDAGIFIATIALTFSLLIFGEVTPKMVATMYPERLALIASFPLKLLIKIIYPFMMIINGISTGLIRLMGINPQNAQQDHLSQEELRTLVHESGSRLTQ